MLLAELYCAIERRLFELVHLSSRDEKRHTELASGCSVEISWRMNESGEGGPTLVAEQRSEDPLIVTFDAVVTKY